MSIGSNIRKYIQIRNLTQKELGIKCGFLYEGADSRIREYESGRKQPKFDILQKIANALQISIYTLVPVNTKNMVDILQILFTLEDFYNIEPFEDDEYNTSIKINSGKLKEIVHYWAIFKEMEGDSTKSKEEYEHSKLILLKSVYETFNEPLFTGNEN